MQKTITILFLLLSTASFGQLAITPNPVFATGASNIFDITAHATITNNSTTDSLFSWKRIDISVATDWETAVCDINTCYGVDVDSADFTLSPGKSGNLDLHFYVNDNPGNVGTGKVIVYKTGDPSSGDTISYEASAFAVSVEDIVIGDKIELFPNPVVNSLSFRYETDQPFNVDIYNVLGSKVQSFVHRGTETKLNMEALPKGIYYLKFRINDEAYTKSFVKSSR